MSAGTAILIGVGLLGLGVVGYLAVRPSPVSAAAGTAAGLPNAPSVKGGNTSPGYGAGDSSAGVWDFLTGLVKPAASLAGKAINSGGGDMSGSGYGGTGGLDLGSDDTSFDDFWADW